MTARAEAGARAVTADERKTLERAERAGAWDTGTWGAALVNTEAWARVATAQDCLAALDAARFPGDRAALHLALWKWGGNMLGRDVARREGVRVVATSGASGA